MELFGDPETYHAIAEQILDTGAALDTGMLYFDARLAVDYPTVEVRVADVCTEVEDAVLVATSSGPWWRRRHASGTAASARPSGAPTSCASPAGARPSVGSPIGWSIPSTTLVAAVADVLPPWPTTWVTPWTSRATPTSSAAASGGSSLPATGPTASARRSRRGGDLVAVVHDLLRRTEASWS